VPHTHSVPTGALLLAVHAVCRCSVSCFGDGPVEGLLDEFEPVRMRQRRTGNRVTFLRPASMTVSDAASLPRGEQQHLEQNLGKTTTAFEFPAQFSPSKSYTTLTLSSSPFLLGTFTRFVCLQCRQPPQTSTGASVRKPHLASVPQHQSTSLHCHPESNRLDCLVSMRLLH